MLKRFKKIHIFGVAVFVLLGAFSLGGLVSAVVPGTNRLVSSKSTGGYANDYSTQSLISPNGKKVVYYSGATNMMPTGGQGLFIKDLDSGNISRVNISTSGVVANTGSTAVQRISANGRYILFTSKSTNLIDGTTVSSTNPQLYLRDTVLMTTTLVSKSSTGIISDGTYISSLGVSSDGRFVSYTTNATNLSLDATDNTYHLYMLDRLDNSVSILDRKTDGTIGVSATNFGPTGAMSCDGTLIVFGYTTNLIIGDTWSQHNDIYLLDRRGATDKITNLTKSANSQGMAPTMSCNGDFIGLKSSATNLDTSIPILAGYYRPYVYDRVNGAFRVASMTSSGTAANTQICGTFINENPCVQVSDTGIATFAADDSSLTGVSGRQIYINNIYTGSTELVSKNSSGIAGNNGSQLYNPTITADGSTVSYASDSTNLIVGQTNLYTNVFTSLTGY